jgi:hypothetical protein
MCTLEGEQAELFYTLYCEMMRITKSLRKFTQIRNLIAPYKVIKEFTFFEIDRECNR